MNITFKTLPKGDRKDARQPATILEPCPFCGAKGFLGAEATYSHNARAGEMDYAIRCGNCDSLGPWGATAYVAASLWNKREEPRNTHRGRSAVVKVATAAIVALLAFMVPVQAGEDWSAFPTTPPNVGNNRFWCYDSRYFSYQDSPKPAAQVIDSSPGVIDDPACRGLIVAQLKDVNSTVADWIIEYNRAFMLPDSNGGANVYHATNRKNGKIWEIIVAFHFEQVQAHDK